MRHILGAETLAVVLGNEAGVELPTYELRVGQQGGLEGDVAADATDHEGIERLSHLGNGLVAVAPVDDQLGDHRVVVHRDLAALVHARVHPYAAIVAAVVGSTLQGIATLLEVLRRRLVAHQTACGRQEVAEGVFRIDTAFDGPTVARNLILGEG